MAGYYQWQDIINGQVWQTLQLEPETYTFGIPDLPDTNPQENGQLYLLRVLKKVTFFLCRL